MNLADLVGKPWEPCATGPDAFDCWGLVRYVYKHKLGILLPDLEVNPLTDPLRVREIFRGGPALSAWTHIPRPVDYGIVVMAEGRAFCHVGLFLACDGGVVLHTSQRTGCVVDKLAHLQRSVYQRFRFYRYGASDPGQQSV